MFTIPVPDQIWKKNDNRFERYIKILDVDSTWVKIITCNVNGEPLRGRATYAMLSRFNKGYRFIKTYEKEKS